MVNLGKKSGLGWTVLLVAAAVYLVWRAGIFGVSETPAASVQAEVTDGEIIARDEPAPAEAAAGPLASVPGGARLPLSEAGSSGAAPRPSASDPASSEVLVYGSVLDPAARRVALEWIRLEDEDGTPRSGSTSSAGSWSVAGLAPGRWEIRARARGYVEHRGELELRGDRPHVRHDLVLEPALAIRVKLVDETGALLQGSFAARRDLPQIWVVATLDPLPEGPGGASGRDAGLWGVGEYEERSFFEPRPQLPAGYSGILRLRAPLPLHVSAIMQDAVLETREVVSPIEELVFTLDRARIEARLGGLRLRAVDALSGAPIAEGSAVLEPAGGGQLGADGVARIEGQAPGIHELVLRARGYEVLRRSVRVPSGRAEDLGDVPLSPAATIRGRIVDARGNPVNASLLCLSALHLRSPLDVEPDHTWVTRGGRFEIQSAAREVLLIVHGQDRALCARAVDASSGQVEDLVIELPDGVPVSFRPRGKEALGKQVTIADAAGRPLWTGTILGPASFSLRLAPGTYQLWIGVAERVDSVEELVIGDEPVAIELPRGR